MLAAWTTSLWTPSLCNSSKLTEIILSCCGSFHHKRAFMKNCCLRDTIASMMLSGGATLAEVAHQLGHAPGSPMTRRYAKFIPAAQQSIANKA